MVIDHALKNRGRRVIDSTEYDHNFFMIDHLPIGPDVVFRYFFAPKATDDLKGLAQVNGNETTFPHELQTGQTFHTFLQGFGTSPRDYGFQLENRKASAGVKVTGDTPLSNLALWSIRTTACTEPYVHTRVEPGKSVRWKYVYQFYTIP